MTVQELIEKLQTFDPNMLVVVDGYEGGVSEAEHVSVADIILDYNKDQWYCGKHELASWITDEERSNHTIVQAIYIPR
jgi:hypothetical protein